MKAAVYARKSNDDNERNEDNKSVTRQIERAKAYAAKKGWTVDDEHVFVDDGISGAEFKHRPALLRMLNHLRDFDVIVMAELSRLGREQSQTSSVLASISGKGVRILFYLTDEELRFESAVDKFMVSAVSFAAELEREKASQRSRDALERKAQKGYNAGGRVYGYDNRPVYVNSANGEQVRSHTEYAKNEHEADVVRHIYRAYVSGHGVATIAKALNGDPQHAAIAKRYFNGRRPPSPRNGTGSWAPSSIRAILHNVRYTGVIPYGKHRKKLDLANGTKTRVKQAGFLLIPAPDLRIVDDKLWAAVQERHAAAKKTYLRDTRGKLWGNPGSGSESKYLLTGMGSCGCCGANITMVGGQSGSGDKRRPIQYYGCSYRQNRGATVCSNDTRERMDRMDDAVLDAIEIQVLNPANVAFVVEHALADLARRRRDNPERPQELEAELKKVRREVGRFMELVADGSAPRSVLAEIANRETRIEALEKELRELAAHAPDELDMRRLRKAVEAHAAKFKDLLRGDVPRARQALRKLLVGKLRFTPVLQAGRKSYTFEGQTRVGPLLVTQGYIEVASPGGFEPPLPP